MNDPERRARLLADAESQYAAIGRFAVKFEHVVQRMQMSVGQLLRAHGLHETGLVSAVLAGLTADPMLSIYRAAVMEVRKSSLSPEDAKILQQVVSRIRKLIEIRNDIIHRTWFVGWAAEFDEELTSVTGFKYKNTGTGSEFRTLQFTIEDFDKQSAEADQLSGIVHQLMGALVLGEALSLFVKVDADGIVRV